MPKIVQILLKGPGKSPKIALFVDQNQYDHLSTAPSLALAEIEYVRILGFGGRRFLR